MKAINNTILPVLRAPQLWLLEVVQFAVETAPPPLLSASICVQLMRVLVERKNVGKKG